MYGRERNGFVYKGSCVELKRSSPNKIKDMVELHEGMVRNPGMIPDWAWE